MAEELLNDPVAVPLPPSPSIESPTPDSQSIHQILKDTSSLENGHALAEDLKTQEIPLHEDGHANIFPKASEEVQAQLSAETNQIATPAEPQASPTESSTAVYVGHSDSDASNAPSRAPMSEERAPITNGQRDLPPPPQSSLPQTPTSSSAPQGHRRSFTISNGHTVSIVLITSALETISSSKEAKRSQPLRDSTKQALEMIRAGQGGDRPREVFEPLRLACETRSEKLMIASLDCISKLISYSFFEQPGVLPSLNSPPPSPSLRPTSASASQTSIPEPSLVDLVVHTITACHTENTPEPVSLQIVKALLALVLSPNMRVHHSALLKAVRTVYNVFLLSNDPVNQMVAQGGLSQMVHHIFARCRTGEGAQSSVDSRSLHHEGDTQASHTSLQSSEFQTSQSHYPSATREDSENALDSNERAPSARDVSEDDSSNDDPHINTDITNSDTGAPPISPTTMLSTAQMTLRDFFVKDAFLVFRALCKLTMKPLNSESERDPKSHAMRSKLLSLQLVLIVLNSHMPLFVDPSAIIYSSSSNDATTFAQSITQYLCLSLSRNAISPVPQIFEISIEIFWRVLSGMRTKLKKEIEVLLHEIFIPILEMRTSTLKQKATILGMLSRLFQDPQAVVEIYLNYDCDSEAIDNIYEHLINIISKVSSSPVSHASQPKGHEPPASPAIQPTKGQGTNAAPSFTNTSMSVSGSMNTANLGLSEAQLKKQGLECLVYVLKSLVAWGTASNKSAGEEGASAPSRTGEPRESIAADTAGDRLSAGASVEMFRQPTPEVSDDPGRFESAKQRKITLLEGIKKFNSKPKRGIQFLVENGFIPSSSPQDVAVFLLNTDGLSKASIGEYLGEGDEENIAIMHAFVDRLDFRDQPFVDALRMFLQSFRLPGESQKIDRFMLKFAERFIDGNSQTPFANADAAYVLAYSTIMLNTASYNPQVKARMSKTDFIKMNRGINDGSDLPEEFLTAIFDDILSNEIRMKDEVEASLAPATGLANTLANVGRDLQKEAYVMQSTGLASKSEALFRTLMRSQRRGPRPLDQFFSASHFVHVKPMFELAWIPFLAGLSGPLQDTDDLEIVELCLDGFKSAIRIVCFFDLELQRNAFVTTLAKFTFLNNLGEMKAKNMEAIKALLDVAVTDGSHLRASWREVLTCVSQLEHMQLISAGVEVPDTNKKGRTRKLPTEELANESRSTHITVAADMVFSLSHYLSGTAIVDFVQALCHVSWEEIQSSGSSNHPRLFSLQKLVEISYYNMNRIRLEWSNLWDILGEHFNQVCCHTNSHVGFFALDSLRQLSARFLEKEELPHFKFQKDFLKPFEYTMIHNDNPDIRDMVLQCLQQMIQARVHNMRSGWRTMFGVFSAASHVQTERIANSAFEIVTRLNKEYFTDIIHHGAFPALTVCVTEFCKVSKYQKISLLAIAMLRGIIPVMLERPECSLSTAIAAPGAPLEDSMIKYWFPVLFGFYDIIMNGEDLEVRRLALDSLFSTLKKYGRTYPVEFWDTICQQLLFPIFAVLKNSQDVSRFSTQEDMSVWLSTTMIQALRDLIDLYTFFFDILERSLNGLLDLLCVCICQENDTLARIGTSCLQQLLENNVSKLSTTRWEHVVTTFVKLFRTTTPHQLFDESLRVEIDGSAPEVSEFTGEANGQAIVPAPLSPNSEQPSFAKPSLADRRRIFKQIIVKCVLQLLLIETTNDLLRNDEVYNTIPPEQLLRLMGVLDHSYQFARSFNEDKELRTGLWKVGFMKHLPNLLKQESSSASTLVHILFRMYYDARPEHQAARPQIAHQLLPLSLGVLRDFNSLRADTQGKNIQAWTPVVSEILEGFSRFDGKAFSTYLSAMYPLVVELLARDISVEIRSGLRSVFTRVGYAQGIIDSSS
jgi:brefeldin A-inhibited guanine nucleotide-exchange protein